MITFKSRAIPLLEAGPERELMARFLFETKRIKGLTKALVQTAGVNAKWLKPDGSSDHPVLGVCIGAGTVEARKSY